MPICNVSPLEGLQQAQACQFSCRGLTLQGLRWGHGATKVLALHGWLDNAASFAALALRLPGVELVALELAGHGLSDHRSRDASYNIWDDLADLPLVLDQLGWSCCHLLGHSRGAVITTLFTAANPDRVLSWNALDGLLPAPVPLTAVAEQLRRAMHDRDRLAKPVKHYPRRDEVVERFARRSGLAWTAAAALAERGLAQDERGWYWRADPRLQGPSWFKLSQEHNEAILQAIKRPGLLIWAEQGLNHAGLQESLAHHCASLRVEQAGGGHHLHLDGDVESVAAQLHTFWRDNMKDEHE